MKNNELLEERFKNLIGQIINLSKNYDKSNQAIMNLIYQKSDLININIYQEKDDIKFYKSIFEDAIFYLRKSFNIRKKKFVRDFIKHYKYLDNNISNQININDLTKKTCITSFNKFLNQKNRNNYMWVKNDRLKMLSEWMNIFQENIKYHIYIHSSLQEILDLNIQFFTTKVYDNEDDDLSGNQI